MSVEFSDSDTLLNYTGIVKTWSAGGQVCLCGGGGRVLVVKDLKSRGNTCFSLPADESDLFRGEEEMLPSALL